MKTLSLKLDDILYKETEQLLEMINKPRNRYINEALYYYNRIQRKKILSDRLALESKLVSGESMKVLKEFEILDDYERKKK
jgi:predicted transcriptional regulator